MIVGALLTSGVLLFLAQAPSLIWLGIGYLALQVSDDVGSGPYAGLIPETVPENQRGLASGVLSQLTLGAQLVSATMALVLRDPRYVYYGIIVVTLLSAAIAYRKMGPSEPRQVVERLPFWKGYFAPWQSADFRRSWRLRLAAGLGIYLIQSYLKNLIEDTYVQDNVGHIAVFGKFGPLASQAVVMIGLTIAVSGAIGATLAGRQVDRLGRKVVMGAGGTTVVVVLIVFGFVRDMGWAEVLAAAFGLAYGCYLSA